MVLFNYATKELTAKVVYYGPGLCGKTTNLQHIYDTLPEATKGKMLSLATKTDRTLFFDFLPIDLGNIRGMKTKIQLYTVPGQVFYDTTRKLVLKGADGVVFVADSQAPMLDANIDSFDNLITNLREQNQELENLPHVIQFNKRDMKNILSPEVMDEKINRFNAPYFEAVAPDGIGVFETLKGISKLVLKHLTQKYGLEPERERKRRMPPQPQPATPPPVETEESHPQTFAPPEPKSSPEQNAPEKLEHSEVKETKTHQETPKRPPIKLEPIPEIELDTEDEEIIFDEEIEEEIPITLDSPSPLQPAPPIHKPTSIPPTADFSELPLEDDLMDDSGGLGATVDDSFESKKDLRPIPSLDDSEVIELDDLEPMDLNELEEIAEFADPPPPPEPIRQGSTETVALDVPIVVTLPASLKGKSLKFQFEIKFEE